MPHYRMYKLRTPHGGIIKAKDIDAPNDGQAMKLAAADDDCPICEVWQGAKPVGTIDEERPSARD